MRGFEKKELIGSLFCPALTLIWGLVRALVDFSWGAEFTGKGSFRLTYFAAILIGGILPIILTLAGKIHTEQYLKKRLIAIVIVYVLTSLVSMGYAWVLFVFDMLVCIGAIVYQVMRVQDEDTSGGERAVMMLSDPIVYWTIYWFILWFIVLYPDLV